jgi:hypothetical protein
VWAVSLGPSGITWSEAEITKITSRNVMVRYAGATARLDRKKLWRRWAWWRARSCSCRRAPNAPPTSWSGCGEKIRHRRQRAA